MWEANGIGWRDKASIHPISTQEVGDSADKRAPCVIEPNEGESAPVWLSCWLDCGGSVGWPKREKGGRTSGSGPRSGARALQAGPPGQNREGNRERRLLPFLFVSQLFKDVFE